MPDKTLKEKLINKLKNIDDPAILEEVSNLFELQEPETIYEVNDEQRRAILEAKDTLRNTQIPKKKQGQNDHPLIKNKTPIIGVYAIYGKPI